MTNSCSQTHFSFNQSFERPATYGASAALRDEPLPTRSAGGGEAPLGVVVPGLGVLQRRARPDGRGQPAPTLDQGPVGEILPVHLEEVEDAIDHRVLRHLLRGRNGNPEALLEPGERCLVTVVGHHLTVEQEVPGALSRHRSPHLGVGAGEILAGTRLESHIAALFAGDAALTVELALQYPVIAEFAAIGQRGQHEGDHHADIVAHAGYAGTGVTSPGCRPMRRFGWPDCPESRPSGDRVRPRRRCQIPVCSARTGSGSGTCGINAFGGTVPSRPASKSSSACAISSRVFMTKGP